MNPVHLAWVPFGLSLGLFVVATVVVLVAQLVRYPFLGRFDRLYDRDPDENKRLNLRVVIVGWGSLLLGFVFSAWSLFRFAQLVNLLFAGQGQLAFTEKLLVSFLPFAYALIPYHLMRFSTAMVMLAAPRDCEINHGFDGRHPAFVGLWRSIDTAMTLLILFFTPSAFKWVANNVVRAQQLPATLALGVPVLLGAFALSVRSDRSAWVAGNMSDLFLLLGKLAVVLVLFVLVATLVEVDLVEVASFAVLGMWIAVAAWWGSR